MCALDHPPMLSQSVVALDTPARNPILDAAELEMLSAPCEVVALVGMQPVRPATRPATRAGNRRQGIDQLFEDYGVVTIGPGHAEHQRDTLSVRDDVAFATELATVSRVRSCVQAPRGLGTADPSMLTRLRSSWPAPRSCASKTRCRRCQTPAACQSRRRRQHVMPLPKPNSCGRSSQAMPVRSTNKMPLSASSSDSRGRPPLSDGLTSGSSGWTCFHSAELSSLFLAMQHQRSSRARR